MKAIIARQLEIKEKRAAEAAKISDDLCADSLDIIGFFSIPEEKSDIQAPDEDSDKITTAGDLVLYVEGKMAEK